MSPLVELAKKILANAKKVDEYANALNAKKSTESDVPVPIEVTKARLELLDASQELKQQAQGPGFWLMDLLSGHTDILILRVIYNFHLPQKVPLEGTIAYEDVAQATNVSVIVLRRVFRYAITLGLFVEPEINRVAHSPASRHLVEVPGSFDALGMSVEELAPSSSKVIEALQRYPQATEPTETAFNIAHGTDLPFYKHLAQTPERARRFGAGMRYFTEGDTFDLRHLVAAFPWHEFDNPDFTVVDVGGGQGGVSMGLASATKDMRFIVQDLQGTTRDGNSILPAELRGRIEFMVHNFLTPQQVIADVYLFRWIFHNWSDKYCQDILRNLTPALKNGARILVYEHERGDAPETRLSRKDVNYLDMVMLSSWNGCIRSESDWKRLFAATDSRFVFKSVTRSPSAAMSLIEAVWTV